MLLLKEKPRKRKIRVELIKDSVISDDEEKEMPYVAKDEKQSSESDSSSEEVVPGERGAA